MNCYSIIWACYATLLLSFAVRAAPVDLVPSATMLQKDRPRLLLRPANTPYAIYSYEGKARLNLVHALDVGDRQPPSVPVEFKTSAAGAESITLRLAGRTFEFSTASPFEIRSEE